MKTFLSNKQANIDLIDISRHFSDDSGIGSFK